MRLLVRFSEVRRIDFPELQSFQASALILPRKSGELNVAPAPQNHSEIGRAFSKKPAAIRPYRNTTMPMLLPSDAQGFAAMPAIAGQRLYCVLMGK